MLWNPRKLIPYVNWWDITLAAAPPIEDLLYYQGLMFHGTWQAIDNAHQKAEKSSAQNPEASGRHGVRMTD